MSDNRRGLILGYSGESGMAHACALRLRSLGAEVAVAVRPGRDGAVRDAERFGFPQVTIDANDDRSIGEGFDRVGCWFSRLDFMVHAWVHAPVDALHRPLVELSRADFDQTLSVCAYSLIAACRAALPLLRRSSAARVVTLTSPADERSTPGYHAVAVGKAALSSVVRNLAIDLGRDRILCNAVRFSLIDTAGARRVLGEDAIASVHRMFEKRAPLRAAVTREDVAEIVALLCDERCRGMTGEAVTVDGGFANLYL
jgi:enoyl-[acyl-carrier protein] reductase I